MHPRNLHQGRYDFAALSGASPGLGEFLRANVHAPAEQTIDFADPRAVMALNRALLALHYGVAGWSVPPGYLCPPVPGRADTIHQLADLLADDGAAGPAIRVLDIGTGANGIYPLIGHAAYGWRFVGSDIDARALAALQGVLDANPGFAGAIELRYQRNVRHCLHGVWSADECFDATVCNPPFHGSARKWRHLGRPAGGSTGPLLNFGGQASELWCEGGERSFVLRLIGESSLYARRCRWFSALLSSAANLVPVQAALRSAGVSEQRVLEMAQGQKKSRLVAWSFLDRPARQELAIRRG